MEEEEGHYPSYISRYVPLRLSGARGGGVGHHRVDGRIRIIGEKKERESRFSGKRG